MKTKSVTGWLAQGENIMTYATPEVRQDLPSTGNMALALGRADLDAWEPEADPIYDRHGQPIHGYRLIHGRGVHLAVASDRYQPILHKANLQPVMKAVSDTLGAPCTGVLVNDLGKHVLARFTSDHITLEGDPSPYAKETWVRLRHDAKGALSVFERAQRLFCTNQIPVISRIDSTDLAIRHVGDIDVKVDELVERIRAGRDDWALWEAEMATLRSTSVSLAEFEQFTRAYIPEPIPPVSPTRARNAQNELFTLFRSYREDLGATAYAGYQAIVEWEDKVRSSRGAASRFQRAINPNPNKVHGLRLLMQVAS